MFLRNIIGLKPLWQATPLMRGMQATRPVSEPGKGLRQALGQMSQPLLEEDVQFFYRANACIVLQGGLYQYIYIYICTYRNCLYLVTQIYHENL